MFIMQAAYPGTVKDAENQLRTNNNNNKTNKQKTNKTKSDSTDVRVEILCVPATNTAIKINT